MTDWNRLSALREEFLSLEGQDAVEVHGWLIGVSVAMERGHGAPPAAADRLIAELRESKPPASQEGQ